MSSEWDEIKRLAADLQKAQLSVVSNRLSESNCVEIVNKLVEARLLDVLYTIDGKEYITPRQLEREILDEVVVQGGRVSILELNQMLNVDLIHIETRVKEILKTNSDLFLIHGDLINNNYLDHIAEEINETLQEAGQASIIELSKTFSLPLEFLLQVISQRLGSMIKGLVDQSDPNMLYTEAYMQRNKAKVRGALTALSSPANVYQFLSTFNLQEKLFYGVVEELVTLNRLSGSIVGRHDKAVFIPSIYLKAQGNWVDDFLAQNSYIEYASMQKAGIGDAVAYLKQRYGVHKLVRLSSIAIKADLIEDLRSSIQDAVSARSYVDISVHLSPVFCPDDREEFLHLALTPELSAATDLVGDTHIVSKAFVESLRLHMSQGMTQLAEQQLEKDPTLVSRLMKLSNRSVATRATIDTKAQRKEDRQKKAIQGASQKGGAGRGSREIRTKSLKVRKYLPSQPEAEDMDVDGDDDDGSSTGSSQPVPVVQYKDISQVYAHIQSSIPDADTLVLNQLATQLKRQLDEEYAGVLRSCLLSRCASEEGTSSQDHLVIQEKVITLYHQLKTFEAGLGALPVEDVKVTSIKHLQKGICAEIVNSLVAMLLPGEKRASLPDVKIWTSDVRLKASGLLPQSIRLAFSRLLASLSSKDLDDFHAGLDAVCVPEVCDILLKKLDKKKERQILSELRASLLAQLETETDAATALHAAVVLLFYHHHKAVVHVPGRCVPQLLAILQTSLSPNHFAIMAAVQDGVMRRLAVASKGASEEECAMLDQELAANVASARELVKAVISAKSS